MQIGNSLHERKKTYIINSIAVMTGGLLIFPPENERMPPLEWGYEWERVLNHRIKNSKSRQGIHYTRELTQGRKSLSRTCHALRGFRVI